MKNKIPLIIGIIISIAIIIVAIVYLVIGKSNAEQKLNIDDVNKKISAETPFNEMSTQDITKKHLDNYFQINSENVEKVVGKIPMMNVHASMYIIIEAKEGKLEEVKNQLDAYALRYEEQWESYLPGQYDLVVNRKTGTVGNNVYLIISENSEELEKIIK